MDRSAFLLLTNGAQWLLFFAIALIIFSWVEHKKTIARAGQALFAVLGAYALWALLTTPVDVHTNATDNLTAPEVNVVIFFKCLIITGILGAAGFAVSFRSTKWINIINVVLFVSGLFLFFMIISIVRN